MDNKACELRAINSLQINVELNVEQTVIGECPDNIYKDSTSNNVF
ncbi:hypothetical protein [Bacillus cereus]|nr:hypothetical protein [Bacillus cereus]